MSKYDTDLTVSMSRYEADLAVYVESIISS